MKNRQSNMSRLLLLSSVVTLAISLEDDAESKMTPAPLSYKQGGKGKNKMPWYNRSRY